MWLLTTCWLMSSQSLSSGMFHCLPPHTPQSSQFLLSHMVSYGMEYLLAGLGQLSWLCLLQAPCAPPDLQLVQISFAWSVKVIINHSFTWIILSRYHSAFPVFILIHLVPLYGIHILLSCEVALTFSLHPAISLALSFRTLKCSLSPLLLEVSCFSSCFLVWLLFHQ